VPPVPTADHTAADGAPSTTEKPSAAGPADGGATAAGPSDLDIALNEFHYHRLIVQTAVQDAFGRIVDTFKRSDSVRSVSQQLSAFTQENASVVEVRTPHHDCTQTLPLFTFL